VIKQCENRKITTRAVPALVPRLACRRSSASTHHDFADPLVSAAAETVRGIRGVDVISSSADVDGNGNLSLYKVNCKIAFLVERST